MFVLESYQVVYEVVNGRKAMINHAFFLCDDIEEKKKTNNKSVDGKVPF
jgi:hypothetical protein